jgi:hypothetical protein
VSQSSISLPPRICCRCSKIFSGKAGRILAGKPACPSCGNALRPMKRCASCRQMSNRVGRSPFYTGLACEACRRKHTHATCSRCRRHRRVAERDCNGKPLCPACAGEAPISHICSGCGSETPGGGAAQCQTCSLRARIAHQVQTEQAKLTQPWVKVLFQGFYDSINIKRTRGDMARQVAVHAKFFLVMDLSCSDPSELSQERLLSLYSAKGLRSAENIVAFLVRRFEITWNAQLTIAHSAANVTRATISAAADQPWAKELEAFEKYLQSKQLSARTIRSYITAASALMWHARVRQSSDLTQRNVNGWLQLRRGRANDLLSFATWIVASGGPLLEVNGRPPTPRRKREKKVLARAKLLLARLSMCRTEPQTRALLGRSIALVYGIRLEHLLALPSEEITATVDGLQAQINGKSVTIEPPFTSYLLRLRDSGGQIFPGRAGFKPLSVDVTRYHVRRLGQKLPESLQID